MRYINRTFIEAVEISLLQQKKHKVYYKKARKRLNNKFVINVFLDEYLYLNINEYRNRIQKSKGSPDK